MPHPNIQPSSRLKGVKYEIRGDLARRALELEKAGWDIVKLNIGNPGIFGFRTPETMRLAMIENLRDSEAYSHQKGIFPAREAVVMRCQDRGIMDVTADDVFIGNGVSELILLSMNALLETGDEILVPSPDYPLWTASVTLHGGKPVHYPCPPERDHLPDPQEIAALITSRTRGIVLISPNNPTGAVYPKPLLEAIVKIAEEKGLIIFSDEIYDQVLYEGSDFTPVATLAKNTLCVSFCGLSKVWRACGWRVGWMTLSGAKDGAKEYMQALELLSSLRLCANVTGQWAVQTALGGKQSIWELTKPGGRLWQSRQTMLEGVAASKYLNVVKPMGAMYAFVGVNKDLIPKFDDQAFGLELLERKHVLLSPGTSFNVPYKTHFRVTLLPDWETMRDVFGRMEELLDEMAGR